MDFPPAPYMPEDAGKRKLARRLTTLTHHLEKVLRGRHDVTALDLLHTFTSCTPAAVHDGIVSAQTAALATGLHVRRLRRRINAASLPSTSNPFPHLGDLAREAPPAAFATAKSGPELRRLAGAAMRSGPSPAVPLPLRTAVHLHYLAVELVARGIAPATGEAPPRRSLHDLVPLTPLWTSLTHARTVCAVMAAINAAAEASSE